MKTVTAEEIRTGTAGPWSDTWFARPDNDQLFKLAGAEPQLDADGNVVLLVWDLTAPRKAHQRMPVPPATPMVVVS